MDEIISGLHVVKWIRTYQCGQCMNRYVALFFFFLAFFLGKAVTVSYVRIIREYRKRKEGRGLEQIKAEVIEFELLI